MTPESQKRGLPEMPPSATTIRLVRPVGDTLREFEPMECSTGRQGISRLLRQQLARAGDYGLADLLNDNGDIVGEVALDRDSFQRLRRKLKCRVVEP